MDRKRFYKLFSHPPLQLIYEAILAVLIKKIILRLNFANDAKNLKLLRKCFKETFRLKISQDNYKITKLPTSSHIQSCGSFPWIKIQT